jgi:uncharacterized protein
VDNIHRENENYSFSLCGSPTIFSVPSLLQCLSMPTSHKIFIKIIL